MSEQLLDAYSEINESTGQPYLNTCTLVGGDGTLKVDFNNGRAKVPVELAELVLKHPHVKIPGYDSTSAPPAVTATVPVEVAVDGDKVKLNVSAQDAEAAKDAEELSDGVQAAIEHLEAEGVEVPDVEVNDDPPPARDGFEATTSDGQARCQAAKGDGSQCSNPAKDGEACHLPKHQEQVAG